MATGSKQVKCSARNSQLCDESSESENETEPAKSFHKRLSTNKEIKRSAATKEGFLMKQTWSFQRWRRRYFRLKGHKLYYAKDPKSAIFDEIELVNLSFAESGTKNINHSFQVITPSRSLVLCAESRREMEDWLGALKAASNREYYEQGTDHHDFLSGHHHWYATSHARPTYCNVCRDALSGVTSHGLSCEVCKCKVHKRCAAKAISNCKWTTLASVGKDIIEDHDGNITMPHQWMEGNLPVSAKCAVCDKTCGSVLRLQDWRCLWCRATVHTACRPAHGVQCPLGSSRVSVVPPTALHSVGTDEAWEATRPQGSSPLLVFVNSKSGDNQGVKFLRRFKQLLNPAQVFDLISAGPGLGLRLFRHFDPFRILVCSGDGSVGWVLSEIDRLDMHKQCQVAVLPLGTGNDLARVLGWGSACDDDTHLPQLLEKYEKASTKMLDRWSIMTYERSIALTAPKMSLSTTDPLLPNPISQYEDSLLWHLQNILQSDESAVILNSAKTLCETVKDFLNRVSEISVNQGDEQLGMKCDILRIKLEMLLETLHDEEIEAISKNNEFISSASTKDTRKSDNFNLKSDDRAETKVCDVNEKGSFEKTEKDQMNIHARRSRTDSVVEREALHCRANSLKRAIRNVLEHSELAVDEQNGHRKGMETLKVMTTIIDSTSSTEASPCPSPLPYPHSTHPAAGTITTPSLLTTGLVSTRLTSISPLPDLRRDSVPCDDHFLTLPVPTQFADGSSRRSSGVQQSIQEMEEAAAELVKLFPLCSTQKLDSTDSQITTIQSDLPYDESCTTLCLEVTSDDSTTPTCMILTKNLNKDASSVTLCNDYLALSSEGKLTEYFQSSDDHNETKSNIPSLVVSSLELDSREFLYCNHDTSVSNSQMLIIDTDLQCNQEFCHESGHDSSPSPEMFFKDTGQNVMYDDRDGSDVLSAISNEECSVCSEILDHKSFHAPQNSDGEDVNGHIGHIDSPETSDTTCPNSEPLHGESIMDDMSSVLGHDLVIAMAGKNDEDVVENTYTDDTTLFTVSEMPVDQGNKCQTDAKEAAEGTQFGFENRAFGIDNRCDDQKVCEPVRYCSLAQFVEGNDIARRSFKKHMRPNKKVDKNDQNRQSLINEENECPDTIKIQIQGSNHDLAGITSEVVYDKEDSRLISSPLHSNAMFPQVCVIVEPPSPIVSEELRNRRMRQAQGNIGDTPNIKSKLLGHLSGTPFPDRRSSDHNPNLLGLDSEHMKFLSCSPAATRRISSGSLFKGNESAVLATSAASLYGSSSNGLGMSGSHRDDRDDASKRLPIINPLVQLPTWPNVSSGAGFISKCLLANADALCAAVSPLMDPDETLLEGYYEKSVMNNYFGIGIDAKISLDFHHKREEHPEKCRSRAKNYMWYGVLGSKQWLQKTYKNLEQRVQLECDGQRIPLPSLQGIVILNIPSFMGGTNFWGGTKEDDCFLAPSFDDRILEVVAVFGSVQMAASRLINLQHHRIAQCQTVQINILGDEGVPIQVDGEAWLQPPGMIRIIHKNRMQMLCRNRALETSLRAWEEKQRAHSISREHSSTTAGHLVVGGAMDTFSEQESYLLLNFIECASTLVKWVKFLTISHPSLEADLYSVAAHTASCLESIHPNGKIVEGHDLREHLTELVSSARQLYEETCVLLRDKAHHLTLREDLETKLSASLANMEGELRRCVIEGATGTPGGHAGLVYLHAVPPDESERKHRKGLFWLKFRGGKSSGGKSCSRDVASWGVQEVATWLEAMQLGEYVDSFTRNDVRGKELLTLARRDLKDLSVTKVGHVKRILQAVKDLSG